MISLNKRHPLYQEDLQKTISANDLEKLSNCSFLITGATGLIGTFLIDALIAFNKIGGNVHIYAVGRSEERAEKRFGEYYKTGQVHFIKQDVRYTLTGLPKIDYIIPLASNTHPLAYSQYPIETIETNVMGAQSVLQLAEKCGAVVIYPSSVEIYGNARGEDEFTEEYTGMLNLSTARSCYTESKRLCESLCQSYIAERGVRAKILRLSRIFGPTMLESDTKASSQFIKKAISGEDIVLKSLGNQFFSYLYVADAVSALLCVLLKGDNGMAYNIASEQCNIRLKDFANICANISGREVCFDLPSEEEQKGFSIASRAILNNKRLTDLGWKSLYNIHEAISRTIKILTEDINP